MPKLITRCLSEDYQTVIDNHDDDNRGELDLSDLSDALFSASLIMPHSADPDSPHRPAVGVIVAGELRPTFFYISDYQGSFSLESADTGVFEVEDIINLVLGKTTIQEVQNNKVTSVKSMKRGVYITFGFILLVILYFTAATIFEW